MMRRFDHSMAAALAMAIGAGAACSEEGTALPVAVADAGAPDATAAIDAGALATKGAAFVLQRDCAQCHQADGDGLLSGSSTPTRQSASAFSKNLTPDPDTGIDGWSDDDFKRAILDGRDDQGQDLCPPMPHFRTLGMADDEAVAIAAYLRTLPPVHHYVPDSTCPPLKPRGDAGADAAPDAAPDATHDASTSDANASDASDAGGG